MWNRVRFAPWVAGVLLGQTSLASAEWRCDCMTIVDSCQATVVVQPDVIEVTTDRPQCARVDYFIDGLPFVAVAVDGRARQDWLAQSGAPHVVVQSCQVCLDRTTAGTGLRAPAAPIATDAPDALEPLIEIAPLYPSAAQARGLDGHVDLAFVVTADGSVSEPSVVAAEPAALFDAAALDAVRRWRFPAVAGRDPVRIERRLEFNFASYVWQLRDAAAPAAAAPFPNAPLNECVREGVTYNYGDTVEVDLLNACPEPVLVYGCAHGTGAYLDRWICQDSDAARTALVARNDLRSGGQVIVASPQGAQSYAYTDGYSMLRAPNTQAWWIACHADDAACRSRARQWVRALHGQPASINPRARTELRVAHSH